MSNITDEKIVRWRELTQREHNAGVLVSVDADTLNALIDEVERLRAERLAVAERAAREMRHEAAMLIRRSTGREPQRIIVEDIYAINVAAIARRAVEEQEKP